MLTWSRMCLLIGAIALAACATSAKSFDDDDGYRVNAGGEGGTGGAGATSGNGQQQSATVTSNAGPGPATTTSGVTTGPMGCDSGTGNDINSVQCQMCVQCSLAVDCVNEANACLGNQQCLDYETCVSACQPNDITCFDNCDSSYPTGSQLYLDMLSCAVCFACPIDCDAINNCS